MRIVRGGLRQLDKPIEDVEAIPNKYGGFEANHRDW